MEGHILILFVSTSCDKLRSYLYKLWRLLWKGKCGVSITAMGNNFMLISSVNYVIIICGPN